MATPNGARHRDLEQRLRDIEAQIRQLNTVALRRKQLAVTSGDFVVSGGGSIVVEDAGNLQLLDALGNVVFDAASGPIKVAAAEDTATGFTVNTTLGTKATASVVVPDGYTQALRFGSVEVCARNTRAVLDYMWTGTPGSLTDVTPGAVGQCTSTDIDLQGGLNGGDVLSMVGRVQTGGGGWGTDGFNSMSVHMLAIFLR